MADKNGSISTSSIDLDGKSFESNICRIVVDESIEKNIILDELSAPKVNSGNNGSNENVAGREFPVIRINDYSVNVRDINKLAIYVTDRIPTLFLSFNTVGTTLSSNAPIKDGDICSIFAAPKSDTLSSLRMDFVITGATPKNTDSGAKITVTGKLFIPGFDADVTFGNIGTTKDVFIDCAKRYGLGFATDDLEEMNDKQLWICNNMKCEEFLNSTISHAWKDETSFFDWWIDPYYNLNFINVNLMMLQNNGEIDITALTSEMGGSFDIKQDMSQDATKAGIKLLTNVKEINRGIFYVTKHELHNNSTEISLDNGVEIKSNEFMHNMHIYEGGGETLLNLSNVPAYDQKLVDSHIVLRGRAEYSKETAPKTDGAKANYNYKEIYIKKPWCGISYVMSDGDADGEANTWSGNINKNYTRSPYHNKINLDELDKMYLTVEVDGLCTQIMRGELVPVALKKSMPAQVTSARSEDRSFADTFYNGYYYVSDITYEYKMTDEKVRAYKTKFTLKRREWPIPVDYKEPNQ